ncbi:MAG: helix-turn-helix transcriptional regulator [Clostridiales bacterium]|nr:helix-turn-helix transcriptional regulator [Clostridiales bacterium]
MKTKFSDYSGFMVQYSEDYIPTLHTEHFHNSYEIVYVVAGSAQFTISDKNYTAKNHCLMFVNNFESHRSSVEALPYQRYFMLMSQEFLRSYVHDPILLSIIKQRPNEFCHMIQLKPSHHQVFQSYFNTIQSEYTNNSQYCLDMIGSTINMMLIDLFRKYPSYFPSSTTSKTLQLISKVEKYIENHFKDDITLKEISAYHNIDMYYLSRLFKDTTGFGFKEYLISQRLSFAKELLIGTNDTITNVCTFCGFNNVNHFIRIFKEKEGVTPLRFRKNMLR